VIERAGTEQVRARDSELLAGMAVAGACFAATFRGPGASFWRRMTGTGVFLGTWALWWSSDLRRLRPRMRHMVHGAAIAAGLYVLFMAGDRLARRIMPNGASDIGSIYALRSEENEWLVAARLGAVIAPAEELFWRGWLQRSLSDRRGRWSGAAVASGAYSAVHVASGNPTLVGAAAVAGCYWSALAASGVEIESLIVSHILWDIVIFLLAPTTPPIQE
jgi:uncharacterized protein